MKKPITRICILALLAVLTACNVSESEEIAKDSFDVDEYQSVDQDDIKGNRAALENAKAKIKQKDYQSAISYLDAYIESKPRKYEAYLMRGDCYYELRQYAKAEADYQKAIEIKSVGAKFMANTKTVSAVLLGADKTGQNQNPELGTLYGRLMYAQKALNKPEYADTYKKAFEYNSHIYLPKPKDGEIAQINCPQKYGKALNPKDDDVYLYGAIEDIENENYTEAIYQIGNITQKYPNYYLGHYLTGVALVGLDREDDALISFNKALRLNKMDFESLASVGQIYYNKAAKSFNKADAEKSINYFRAAQALNRDCYTYYFYIGLNEMLMDNYKNAISSFDKALALKTNDYNSMYYKMLAQYLNGDYEGSIATSKTLLNKHVSNMNSVLYSNALSEYKLKQYDKALEDLNKIIANFSDIYNKDLRTVSPKEKTLDRYVAYLKSRILKDKGVSYIQYEKMARENEIIDAILNSENLIQIPYEEIDNQIDYIKTTFKNYDYKIIEEAEDSYAIVTQGSVANSQPPVLTSPQVQTVQPVEEVTANKNNKKNKTPIARGTGNSTVTANAPVQKQVGDFVISYENDTPNVQQNSEFDNVAYMDDLGAVGSNISYNTRDDIDLSHSIHRTDYMRSNTTPLQTPMPAQMPTENVAYNNVAAVPAAYAPVSSKNDNKKNSKKKNKDKAKNNNNEGLKSQQLANGGYIFTQNNVIYGNDNIIITSIKSLAEEDRGATDYKITYEGSTNPNPPILATGGVPLPMTVADKGLTDYKITYDGTINPNPPVLANGGKVSEPVPMNNNVVADNKAIIPNNAPKTDYKVPYDSKQLPVEAGTHLNETAVAQFEDYDKPVVSSTKKAEKIVQANNEKPLTNYQIAYEKTTNTLSVKESYIDDLDIPMENEQPEGTYIVKKPANVQVQKKTPSTVAISHPTRVTNNEKPLTNYQIAYEKTTNTLSVKESYIDDLDIPMEKEQPEETYIVRKPENVQVQKRSQNTVIANSNPARIADTEKGATDFEITYQNKDGSVARQANNVETQPTNLVLARNISKQPTQTVENKQPQVQQKPAQTIANKQPQVQQKPAQTVANKQPQVQQKPAQTVANKQPQVQQKPAQTIANKQPQVQQKPAQTVANKPQSQVVPKQQTQTVAMNKNNGVREKHANVDLNKFNTTQNQPMISDNADVVVLNSNNLLFKAKQQEVGEDFDIAYSTNKNSNIKNEELNLSVPIEDTTIARRVQKENIFDDDFDKNEIANSSTKEYETIEDLRNKDLSSKDKVAYAKDKNAVSELEKSKAQRQQNVASSQKQNNQNVNKNSKKKNSKKKKSFWKRLFGSDN